MTLKFLEICTRKVYLKIIYTLKMQNYNQIKWKLIENYIQKSIHQNNRVKKLI